MSIGTLSDEKKEGRLTNLADKMHDTLRSPSITMKAAIT